MVVVYSQMVCGLVVVVRGWPVVDGWYDVVSLRVVAVVVVECI